MSGKAVIFILKLWSQLDTFEIDKSMLVGYVDDSFECDMVVDLIW